MSTPTVGFLREMIDAFWAHVEADARFKALNLKLYKLTDGKALPVKQDGGISSSDLPACFVDSFTPSFGDPRTEPRRWEVNVELPVSFAYANTQTHSAHTAALCAEALMTMQLILGNQTAIRTRLGNAAVISGYDFEIGEVQAVLDPTGRRILYWVGDFKVTLQRLYSPPAA